MSQQRSQYLPFKTVERVIVHPIALLSISDHHFRMGLENTEKRVIGVLIGDVSNKVANVTQCFALPFEESNDDEEDKVFFVDGIYLEEMYELFKKVHSNEFIVGWYTSDVNIRKIDLDIHEFMKQYVPNPILMTVDVKATRAHEIPCSCYLYTEDIKPDGKPVLVSFKNVHTEIGFMEIEEVGVEQLLRDIKDVDISQIGTTITNSIHGLSSLEERLNSIAQYLDDVHTGRIEEPNNEIIGIIQSIFNLLPNLTFKDTLQSLAAQADESSFMIFLSQIIKCVVSVHDLVNIKKPPPYLLEKKDDKEGKKTVASEDAKPVS